MQYSLAFVHFVQLHAPVVGREEKKKGRSFNLALGVTAIQRESEKNDRRKETYTRKMKIAQEIRLSARRAKALFRALWFHIVQRLQDMQKNDSRKRTLCINVIARDMWRCWMYHNHNQNLSQIEYSKRRWLCGGNTKWILAYFTHFHTAFASRN